MLERLAAVTTVILVLAGCSPRSTIAGYANTPAAAAAADSVRGFMTEVATGLAQSGPSAWRRVFQTDSGFYMASEGAMVFADGAAAERGIHGLEQVVRRIELQWGSPLRVDPIAPGAVLVAAPYHEIRTDTAGHRIDESGYFTALAAHGASGWRFRNAHWSAQPHRPPRG